MNKQIISLCLLGLLFSCTNKPSYQHPTAPPKQDTLQPPKVTVLADLPDSLQPRLTLLDTLPKPTTVPVPTQTGGYWTIMERGVPKKVALEPPVAKHIQLFDAHKNPIAENGGTALLMNGGGLSNFTTFTTNDGLCLDATTCILKDKIGNLWIGTAGGGVSRYDGKSFVTFSTAEGLANNDVVAIAEDKSGNIWLGTTGGGVSRYDGKSFTNFTTAQGLAHNDVNCIFEDKKGNMWFGTWGGVSRYSPSATASAKPFVTFTTAQGLPHNQVWCIAEDKTGKLWMGTNGGVCRYTPEGDGTTNANAFVTFTTAQGLADNKVYRIAVDKTGNIWLGTFGGGVSLYKPESNREAGTPAITTFTTAQGLANNYVLSIAEDKSAPEGQVGMWFSTNGGVSYFSSAVSPTTGTKYFENFTAAQGLANDKVSCICTDDGGNVWFGTYNGGVSRYNGKAFVTFSKAHGLADNVVQSIAEDRNGNLWLGVATGGVSCYHSTGEGGGSLAAFTNFSTAQGLGNNMVFSISEDKRGSIWLGTFGGGVTRYDPASKGGTGKGAFTTFTKAQGLPNNVVRCIAEDKTTPAEQVGMWFGTDGGGVSYYNGKSFTTFSIAQGLANDAVLCIAENKTIPTGQVELWLGTDGGGVSRYDGKSFLNLTTAQGLASNQVWCITPDKAGNLWLGTSEGLCVLSKKDMATLTAYAQARVDKKSNAEHANWLVKVRTFTKTDGLPDNFVTQIRQLPNGKMAVGTNLGIAVFAPSPNLTLLGDMEIFNTQTDCPVKDINTGQNGMYVDHNGIIWAGTGNDKTALVRLDYNALNRSKEPPRLIIKGIDVTDERISWYSLAPDANDAPNEQTAKHTDIVIPAFVTEEATTFGRLLTDKERDSLRTKFGDITFDSVRRFYPVPEGLVLPYVHNQITINFNAVETGKPKLVNYQYMLEGYDKDWCPITKNTTAAFGNIPEGNYMFKVKAQGPNGVWCTPVTFTFRVLPPWYRTWWAYSSYLLLFLFALRTFSKWRERKLIAEKEHLEQTVAHRTEELVHKNITIVQQKEEIERKSQAITDNLTYAYRIQQAMLPDKQLIAQCFPQSFVLYLPKDIVSGDFYALAEHGEWNMIACGDCTGHGVSGAFMSMIGGSLLTEITDKIGVAHPAPILEQLNEAVIHTLKQSQNDSNDGMDIALCSFNRAEQLLKYAGANRPLYHIRNGVLDIVKPDKLPIGGFQLAEKRVFTEHTLLLEPGSTFYLFTDGYPDQFGGDKNKKLMVAKFKEVLLNIQALDMPSQKVHLENFITTWKGDNDQVDDILVMGIRV